MIEVGQKVKFDPFAEITGFSSDLNRGKTATGTVVYVNAPHQWFSVKHGNQRTSFKFSQLSQDVHIVK